MMEVLFAVAGCLGAFVLGALAAGYRYARQVEQGTGTEPEAELPPGLRRQWEDFLSYTGYPGEDEHDED